MAGSLIQRENNFFAKSSVLDVLQGSEYVSLSYILSQSNWLSSKICNFTE